jgi:transposase
MSKLRFVGLDVHAETIAVAVAEVGDEVRVHGVIPNRLESIRRLVHKLGPVSICGPAMKRGRPGMCFSGSSRNWELAVR